MLGLSEDSEIYRKYCVLYQAFSQAEDAEGKVATFLRCATRRKTVLDIGCGNGKYAVELAPSTLKYFGIDSSYSQLQLAQLHTQHLSNVEFARCQAEQLCLPSRSIDVVVATWSIGSICGEERRRQALVEAERVVREKGNIYLIENAETGRFQAMRGESYKYKARAYNEWLKQQGYAQIATLSTRFKFSSLRKAKTIFDFLWGDEVATQVTSASIPHDVLIFGKGGAL